MGDLVVVAGEQGAREAEQLIAKLTPTEIDSVSTYMEHGGGYNLAALRSGAVKWTKKAFLLFVEGAAAAVGYNAVAPVLSKSTALPKPQMTKLAEGLRQLYGKVSSAAASKVTGVVSPSNSMANLDRDLVRKQMIERMVRAFGNVQNAEAVAEAILTLKPDDYAWYRRLFRNG